MGESGAREREEVREERDRGSEREEVRVGRGGREWRERGEIRARERVGREIDRVVREIVRGVSGAIERERGVRVERARERAYSVKTLMRFSSPL